MHPPEGFEPGVERGARPAGQPTVRCRETEKFPQVPFSEESSESPPGTASIFYRQKLLKKFIVPIEERINAWSLNPPVPPNY